MPESWKSLLAAPVFAAIAPVLDRLPPDRFPALDALNALVAPSMTSGGGAPISHRAARAGVLTPAQRLGGYGGA